MKIGSPQSPNYKWIVFATIAIGTFLSVVDIGIVNLALPTIERHFSTDLQTLKWITVGYSLAISMLLLPIGRLGDLVGRKRQYVLGLAVFSVAVTVGGLSQSITMLIVSRVIQGIGAAMVQANGMATVVSAFPERERGKALGAHLSVVASGAIAGPAIGGLLVDALGWRSVFFVNVPFAIIAIIASMAVLEKGSARPAPREGRPAFDWPGAVLSAGMLLTFMLAISEGQRQGWGSPSIVTAYVLFIVFLSAFIRWELRVPAPMLDLRIFQKRLVAFGVITGFIMFMGNAGLVFLMTFYLQQVLGYDPRKAGLIIIAGPMCLAFWGPISGRLSDRFGWRPFNIAGQILSASALFLLAFRLTSHSTLALLVPALMLNSSGTGLFNSPNNSSILSAVERSKYGIVSALTQLVRNSAQVTSVAVATTIVVVTMASFGFPGSLEAVKASGNSGGRDAFVTGLHRVFFVMGGLSLFGLVLTLLKGDRAKEPARDAAAPVGEKPALDGPRPAVPASPPVLGGAPGHPD